MFSSRLAGLSHALVPPRKLHFIRNIFSMDEASFHDACLVKLIFLLRDFAGLLRKWSED